MKQKHLSISEFDYHLPEEQIAQRPTGDRERSKLLYYKNDKISHHSFPEITSLLPPGSMVIFNNTKVIPARIFAQKATGAIIQVFLLQPMFPYTEMERALATKDGDVVWQCMVGNAKKWKDEPLTISTVGGDLTLDFEDRKAGLVRFKWNKNVAFSEVLESIGKMPLPPYIKREAEGEDQSRYQTVYAKVEGAVAAPTAGLHFTPEVLEQLRKDGHSIEEVTLHVGAGTFKPVTEDLVWNHDMHAEFFQVSLESLRNIKEATSRIATGTTSLRTLESLYWIGVKLKHKLENPFTIEQHLPYEQSGLATLTYEEAIDLVIEYLVENSLDTCNGLSGIMIMPGYEIRSVDGLITNFHMPKSTLLLLIAALVGDSWKRIYEEALSEGYRFLSYGDSSLLLKNNMI